MLFVIKAFAKHLLDGEECDSSSCSQKEKDATQQTCISEYSIPNCNYSSDSNLCKSIIVKLIHCKAIKIIGESIDDIIILAFGHEKKICSFGSKSKR